MQTKHQVLLASIITLCMVAMLLVIGLQAARQINQSNKEIHDYVIPSLRQLENMRFGVLRIVSSASELIVAKLARNEIEGQDEGDPEENEKDLINTGVDIFTGSYQKLIQLNDSHAGHDHVIFELRHIEKSFEALVAGARIIVSLVESNADAGQFAEAKEEFEALESASLAVLDQAVIRAQTLADRESGDLSNAIAGLHRGIVGLGVLSVLVLLLYSSFVNRLIRHEAGARAEAERLAKDNQMEVERRKRMEQRLASQQKLEALGTLLGGIAHSVNNFLTPIIVLTNLLKKELPKEGEQASYLEHIERAAQNGAKVLKDVLAFSRDDTEVSENSCDLVSCLQRSLSVIKAAIPSSAELEIDLRIDQAWVPNRDTEIETVILNLVGNAADALSNEAGIISIGLQTTTVKDSLLGGQAVAVQDGEYALLNVSDTGPGIAENVLPHIFDPFFTTKDVGKGTGLGLSVTYTSITQAGGDIVVHNVPGSGARFDILLPLMALPQVSDEQPDRI